MVRVKVHFDHPIPYLKQVVRGNDRWMRVDLIRPPAEFGWLTKEGAYSLEEKDAGLFTPFLARHIVMGYFRQSPNNRFEIVGD